MLIIYISTLILDPGYYGFEERLGDLISSLLENRFLRALNLYYGSHIHFRGVHGTIGLEL